MRDINDLPDVLTVGEVASYLRISKTTVCRWCNSGKLPAFRIGRNWRVQRGELERCIRNNKSELDFLAKQTAPQAEKDR